MVTMCGVIGILLGDRNAQVSPELYDGLTILQHRGQDAAGIATSDGRKIHLRKDKGLVRERERERRVSTRLVIIARRFHRCSSRDRPDFNVHLSCL